MILADTFLHDAAEFLPERRVLVLLVLGKIFEQRQHPLHRPRANHFHVLGFLQDLA
ncbi:hypothetical protein D3C83_119520 [compost metagenome]